MLALAFHVPLLLAQGSAPIPLSPTPSPFDEVHPSS